MRFAARNLARATSPTASRSSPASSSRRHHRGDRHGARSLGVHHLTDDDPTPARFRSHPNHHPLHGAPPWSAGAQDDRPTRLCRPRGLSRRRGGCCHRRSRARVVPAGRDRPQPLARAPSADRCPHRRDRPRYTGSARPLREPAEGAQRFDVLSMGAVISIIAYALPRRRGPHRTSTSRGARSDCVLPRLPVWDFRSSSFAASCRVCESRACSSARGMSGRSSATRGSPSWGTRPTRSCTRRTSS